MEDTDFEEEFIFNEILNLGSLLQEFLAPHTNSLTTEKLGEIYYQKPLEVQKRKSPSYYITNRVWTKLIRKAGIEKNTEDLCKVVQIVVQKLLKKILFQANLYRKSEETSVLKRTHIIQAIKQIFDIQVII